MATRGEDRRQLLSDDGDEERAVTRQPRAGTAPSASGVSTLSIVVNSLRDQTELRNCCCFYRLVQSRRTVASAMVIGVPRQAEDEASQVSAGGRDHILKMKNHFSKLKVDIFNCDTNFKGSRAELEQSISDFFSQGNVSLFFLYYSGPTDEEGDWSISYTKYGREVVDFIRIDTVVEKWTSNSNCQLVVIVDANNSSKWVETVKNYESESHISIMAPSSIDSGARSSGSPGLYTLNLIGGMGQTYLSDYIRGKIDRYLAGDPLNLSRFSCFC